MNEPEIKCAVCGWKQVHPYVFRLVGGAYWCGYRECKKELDEREVAK